MKMWTTPSAVVTRKRRLSRNRQGKRKPTWNGLRRALHQLQQIAASPIQKGRHRLSRWQHFARQFPDMIFSELAHFTNVYALQTDGIELGATPQEIRVFFGMLLLLAIVKAPRVWMYWQERTRIPYIGDAMSSKKVFEARAMLHVTNWPIPQRISFGTLHSSTVQWEGSVSVLSFFWTALTNIQSRSLEASLPNSLSETSQTSRA